MNQSSFTLKLIIMQNLNKGQLVSSNIIPLDQTKLACHHLGLTCLTDALIMDLSAHRVEAHNLSELFHETVSLRKINLSDT